MSDIFQEVDEEVRRDKAVEFWAKHQNLILAVALVIVAATGGYRFWQYRQAQAAQAAGAEFQTAIKLESEGKTDEAKAALAKLQKDAPAGYGKLSRFIDAGLALKSDAKAGIAAYDALAADAALDPLLRDAAKLRAGIARLNAGETDSGKAALETLASASPFRSTARLALASLAISAKDWETARKRLGEVVTDAEAPAADRRTAETLTGLVTSQAPPAKKS